VVDEAAFAGLDDFSVHRYEGVSCGFSDWFVADGVETLFSLDREPLIFAESVVVGGIDDGAGRLRKPNSAKRIPVAHPAVEQQGGDEQALKPPSKTECAVNIDIPSPRGKSEIRSTKSETISNLK